MPIPNYAGDSGFDELQRALKKKRDDNAVLANPVGPPAMLAPPDPNAAITRPGVRVDPPNTQLAQDGALRPPTGPFSLSNLSPQLDGNGNLMAPQISRPPTIAASPTPIGQAPQPGAPLGTAIGIVRPGATSRIAAPIPNVSGVHSAAATTAGTPAFSDDGRALGYGRTVDGVRTFTDADLPAINAAPSRLTPGGGPGGTLQGAAGTIQRPQLGAVGPTPGILPIIRPGAPAVAAQPINGAVDTARAFNASAQRDAASDAASIANRDTRSVLGTAARNAAIDAASGFGRPGERRAAYTSALAALNGAAASGIVPAAQLGQTAVRDAGDTARNAASNATALANNANSNATSLEGDYLRRPQPNVTNLADGTAAVIGPDGISRPVTDGQGTLVRPQQARPSIDQGAYSSLVGGLTKQMLGDAPADAETVYRTSLAARDAANAIFAGDSRGAPASQNSRTPAAQRNGPPAAAIDHLRSNPGLRDQFDAKYGKGAAAQVLEK